MIFRFIVNYLEFMTKLFIHQYFEFCSRDENDGLLCFFLVRFDRTDIQLNDVFSPCLGSLLISLDTFSIEALLK